MNLPDEFFVMKVFRESDIDLRSCSLSSWSTTWSRQGLEGKMDVMDILQEE